MSMAKRLGWLACFLVLLTSTACSPEGKYPFVEPRVQDMVGQYKSLMSVSRWGAVPITVQVDEKTLSVQHFPVGSILAAVLPAEAYKEALDNAKNIPYSVRYRTSVYNTQLLLSLEEKPLEFEVRYGGANHKVMVIFARSAEAVFGAVSQMFTFWLRAEIVLVDGSVVTGFEPILFAMDPAKRTSPITTTP